MFRRLFGYEDNEMEKSEEEEEGRSASTPNTPDLKKVLREGLGLPSAETIRILLEPFLRRVVREEVERIQTRMFYSLKSGTRTSFKQIDAAVTNRWKLQFKSKLPHTLFTGTRIEADESSPVQLAIVDTLTNDIVTSGPLASLRVDVVSVDGDFCPDDQGDWTPEQFNNSLLRQREGKPQLLTGDLIVTLDKGVGYLGDLYFTDNSSWIRSRKFRLGLRAQRCGPLIERIQEGLSDPFLVKDHRGESYKKHHPPSLDDEVWRLEKIGKDGAFHRRLNNNKICTVQDFLKCLNVNPDGLRNLLGNGMSNKIWETTVQHAWECEIEKKLCYCYHVLEQQVVLYFDSIYRPVAVDFEGCHYQSIDEMPAHQKALVEKLKLLAYQNCANMIKIADPSTTSFRHLQSSADACSSPDCADSFAPIGLEEKAGTEVSNDWSEKEGFPEETCQQKQMVWIQPYYPSHQQSQSLNNFVPLDIFQNNTTLPCTIESNATNFATFECDSMIRAPGCCPLVSDMDLNHGCLSASRKENYVSLALPQPDSNPQIAPCHSKWHNLLATIKCGMSIRKRVHAKRRARLAQVNIQMHSDVQDTYKGF